jgi:hypothetical protein
MIEKDGDDDDYDGNGDGNKWPTNEENEEQRETRRTAERHSSDEETIPGKSSGTRPTERQSLDTDLQYHREHETCVVR